jgi:hypothetical protein
MAKSFKNPHIEVRPKAAESEAQKNRRRFQQQAHDYRNLHVDEEDLESFEDDDFDTFEPIKKKR